MQLRLVRSITFALALVLGTVALGLGSQPILAQPATAAILSVVAYDATTGLPAPRTTVALSNGRSLTTDIDGLASFQGLTPGDLSFVASNAGGSSGTIYVSTVAAQRTVVNVAVQPGAPTDAYPAVRPTVATTFQTSADGSQVLGSGIQTRVYLTANQGARGVNLAIGAPTLTPINDCWAGAPNVNPCNRQGNNDATWSVGDLGTGQTKGPYTVTYNSNVPPSQLTAAVEVVDVRWLGGSYSVSLGEGEGPLARPMLWLDNPTPANWNQPGASIPRAPTSPSPEQLTRCNTNWPAPTSGPAIPVTQAGWTQFLAPTTLGDITIVWAAAGADGMCRPLDYQGFVFWRASYIGTVSPTTMDSRTDPTGQPQSAAISNNGNTLTIEFSRYSPADPLCCPSATTTVTYTIVGQASATPTLQPTAARTTANQT